MGKAIIAGIIIVLIFIGIAIFAFSPKQQVSVKEIKIGATLPLTGDVAGIGESIRKGIELAAEEINNKGGINGKQIKIIFEDDRCDGKVSVDTVTKLINIDRVSAIIGPVCSAAFLPAAPIAEQNKVILFTGSATNAKITTAGDYIFRDVPSDAFQGKFQAEFVFNTLKKTKVSVGFGNDEYSVGLKETFISRFKELGGTVLTEEANERGATDMRAQLTKIKNTNPEIIYYVGLPADVGNFIKQARELGITMLMLTPETTDDPQVVEIAQEATQNVIYTLPKQSTSEEFKTNYKARFGEDPLIFTDNFYDVVKMIAAAMDICDEDTNCIKTELYKVKNYNGASGIITIDSNGDLASAEYQLKTFINKTAVPYRD